MSSMMHILWLVWIAPMFPMFFGIGQGSTDQQQKEQGLLSGVADFGVNQGEKDTTKATDFWSAIASGDHDAIMRVLGPQISNIKAQGQQVKQTASQFGNRSGGTNATLQRVDDTTRTNVNDLISSLTGASVSGLASAGSDLLHTGVGASTSSFDAATTIQKENAAKWNDVFNSISEIIGGAAGLPGIGATSTTGKVLTGVAGMLG